MADTKLPLRDCDGCGQNDDHPRFQYARHLDGNVVADLLFHYDCIPAYVVRETEVDAGGQAAIDATSDGKRGSDVRAAVVDTVTGEAA